MGDYDWVRSGLSLLTRWLRDSCRTFDTTRSSQPSLVGPGIIMESWIFAHFPSLLGPDFLHPTTYPAFRGYALSDRRTMGWTYDTARIAINDLTSDRFVAKPWVHYNDIPDTILRRCRARDGVLACLHGPYDSFWYLGPRMAFQGRADRFIVPCDPPTCLFVQTDDPVVRREQFREGESETLLRPLDDYATFAQTRLAVGPILAFDPDMEHQPDDFPTLVEYEVGGVRRTLELPEVTTMVTDHGMAGWADRIQKVAGGVHKKLFRTANRWRDLAARQAMRLCACEAELAEYQRREREAQ